MIYWSRVTFNYMRFFVFIFSVFLLAGCSSSEKLLERAAPEETELAGRAPTNLKESEQEKAPSTINQTDKPMYPAPPAMSIDVQKKYTATLTTDKGVIEVELFASATPITVNNFVFLAKEKYYDGVVFHRTIPGFMVQGGDPTGTGMGGPGYSFADEPFTGEYTRGTLAMANAGPNTNGSQFFIMHKDTSLPKSYVIFGRVQSGLEVVDAIATAPTVSGGEGSKPQVPVQIESVTIREE